MHAIDLRQWLDTGHNPYIHIVCMSDHNEIYLNSMSHQSTSKGDLAWLLASNITWLY